LTANSTGGNLPSPACLAGWRFERMIDLRLDNSAPKYELVAATLAAIAKHGFYLTHSAIHGFPTATADDADQSKGSKERLASS
jgi:hypothetical protein